jgi:hypothetical protein
MKKVIGTACLLVVFYSCSFAQQVTPLKWLVGNWKINTGNGFLIEEWQITNDSTLSGKSYFIKNTADTIPQETIELSYRNGSWHFIPTVKNQNNGQAVAFTVIFLKGTEFICENPKHDFPQRIAYRRINHQLFAAIEGKRNGKYSKQNFDYTIVQ